MGNLSSWPGENGEADELKQHVWLRTEEHANVFLWWKQNASVTAQNWRCSEICGFLASDQEINALTALKDTEERKNSTSLDVGVKIWTSDTS